MTAIIPSYVEKIGRAKKHLIELKEAIDGYAATKPYAVRERIEGKKKTHRLVFTTQPANTEIPIIVADVIYNLRSALDHLMGALVPKNQRGRVMFPIFFQGVWEPAVAGENQQRLKDRERWASCVKTLPDEAVAFLKLAQPPDNARDPINANLLRTVNQWSNRDRHEKLPIIAPGMREAMVRFKEADGAVKHGIAMPSVEEAFFKDQAKIGSIPDGAVDVEIAGTPVIAIGVGSTNSQIGTRYLEIPEHLDLTVALIEDEIVPKLAPYVRPDAV